MPIYFLLSIWVLLSVGPKPTPQAYFERGALFYNALTAGGGHVREVANSRGKCLSQDHEHRPADSPSRGAATSIRAPTTHILGRRFDESLRVSLGEVCHLPVGTRRR